MQTTVEDVQALEARHVLQTYRRQPVTFVRGEGVRLFDAEGRAYLDLLSGIGVTALGHVICRPAALLVAEYGPQHALPAGPSRRGSDDRGLRVSVVNRVRSGRKPPALPEGAAAHAVDSGRGLTRSGVAGPTGSPCNLSLT